MKKRRKKKKKKRRKRKKRKRRRSKQALPVLRANSIFDWSASRHSRLRQGSKIDYSSITLRLVSSSILPPSLRRLVASSFSSSSLVSPLSPPILPSFFPHRSPGPSNWVSLSLFFLSLSLYSQPLLSRLRCSTRSLSRPDLRASRLHVACPNDVLERTGTTAI